MLDKLFAQKCCLVYCPHCGRVKKHGKWVELTAYESQKLSQRYNGFNLVEETCTHCQTQTVIGYA
jgi:NMD protein affecting ribosome stability and mRNA decay